LKYIAMLGVDLRNEDFVFGAPCKVAHGFMLTQFRTIATDFTRAFRSDIVRVDEEDPACTSERDEQDWFGRLCT
jgi:hypothetical protein